MVFFTLIGCLLALPARSNAQTDASIRKKILGLWRSPRHEYEFMSDGVVYMLPIVPDTTTFKWHVQDGLFFWDKDPYVILTLTDKRSVYKSPSDKTPGGYILDRITSKMVGDFYDPSSVK